MNIYTLSGLKLAIFSGAGLIVGVSKTGIPGAGLLAVPLVGMLFPAKASTGLVLVMLICGDAFAVSYYRRHAVWRHLFRLLPWAAAGVIIGYFALGKISNAGLKPLIGGIVLAMLVLHNLYSRRTSENPAAVPSRWWFAAVFGLFAGVTTMMANAAGPVMILYLLAMRLPKVEFIGTGAWYFFLMNWFKVPFSASLGLINPASLKLNLLAVPAIVAGAFIGIFAVKRIPQKPFNVLMQVLTALAAFNLLF